MRHHRHHRRHGGGPGHGRGASIHRLRHRLRWRIFAWFGVSILLTAVVSSAIVWIGSSARGGWQRHVQDLRTFAGHRFAAAWHDEAERAALMRDVVEDLHIGVQLRDADGAVIDARGPTCRDPYVVPVGDGLGSVAACPDPEYFASGVPIALWLFVGLGTLWAASGAIARRLTRPLGRLVEVARDIGEGRLESRGRLHGIRYGELGLIAEAVHDMAARIEEQLADQRELLAAVSHELRTPLGHLRVLIELSRQGGADAERLDEIEREVVAIDGLVGQLLASSRVDFGDPERRPLDAVELGLRALDRAGLDATLLEASAERIVLHADASLVLQALANLLRNASEHGGGVTALRISQRGDDVIFDVEDDGPGFGDELERAFEPFRRGEESRARAGSLGLGLALVRRIARAHDGEATAHERPEGGSRVTLRLPRR